MSWTLPVYFRRGFWYQAETAQDIHSPPSLGAGGFKNFKKVFAGGSEIFILVGGCNFVGGGHVILK